MTMRRFIQNIHQSWLVVGLAIGVIIGAVLIMVFRINYLVSPVWIVAVVAAFVVAYLWPKPMFVVVMVFAGMMLTFVRSTSELIGIDYISKLSGEIVKVGGIIEGDPETDEKGTKLKLGSLVFGDEYRTQGTIYVDLAQNEDLARGDQVELEGKLSDGFGMFAGYMYRPRLMKWMRPDPGDLILRMRNWFAERIIRLVPEKEANLGLSYLLGMRANLAEDLDDNLRTVGLVHIVVASGAHLSILIEVTRKIFGKMSRFTGLLFAMIFTIAFMCMIGFTPSILRAGIMTMLTLVAWYCGRKIAAWRLILIVAAVTLMIEPAFVLNLGWLLSFASYAGIMILAPRLAAFFYGAKRPGFLGNILIMTISATVMTLPITLYYFGTLSLMLLIANLLILPTLPWAMGLVFAVGVVAGMPGVEVLVAFLATKLLDFHIAVVDFLAMQQEFIVEVDPYQLWPLGIYLIVAVILTVGLMRRKMIKLREKRLLTKF